MMIAYVLHAIIMTEYLTKDHVIARSSCSDLVSPAAVPYIYATILRIR